MKRFRLHIEVGRVCMVLVGFFLCTTASALPRDYEQQLDSVLLVLRGNKVTVDKDWDAILKRVAKSYIGMLNALTIAEQGKLQEQLVARYKSSGQCGKDYVKMVLPYFAKTVSGSDLKEYLRVKTSEEYRQAEDKAQTAMMLIDKKQVEKFVKGIYNTVRGSGSTRIKAVKCPESYRLLFMDYYRNSDINATFAEATDLMKQQLIKEGHGSETALASKLGQYMKSDEVANMFLNCYYGNVTEDELRILASQAKSPENKRVFAAYIKSFKDSKRMDYMKQSFFVGYILVQEEYYQARRQQ